MFGELVDAVLFSATETCYLEELPLAHAQQELKKQPRLSDQTVQFAFCQVFFSSNRFGFMAWVLWFAWLLIIYLGCVGVLVLLILQGNNISHPILLTFWVINDFPAFRPGWEDCDRSLGGYNLSLVVWEWIRTALKLRLRPPFQRYGSPEPRCCRHLEGVVVVIGLGKRRIVWVVRGVIGMEFSWRTTSELTFFKIWESGMTLEVILG